MKLASLKEGGRDGTLVVVDRAISTRAVRVTRHRADAASRARRLEQRRAEALALRAAHATQAETGSARRFALEVAKVASPLPRAYQWVDGSAYVKHVERVRKARNAEMPESFWTDPLMYQAVGAGMLRAARSGARRESGLRHRSRGRSGGRHRRRADGRFSRRDAAARIRLVGLVNDVSLRKLIPDELAKGFGFLQSKPRRRCLRCSSRPTNSARTGRIARSICRCVAQINGKQFGAPEAGEDMPFGFADLIAHAAKTRPLTCGHDRRLRHRRQSGRKPRCIMSGRTPHAGNDRERQAVHAFPGVRRQGPHRDVRQAGREHLRRDRAGNPQSITSPLPLAGKVWVRMRPRRTIETSDATLTRIRFAVSASAAGGGKGGAKLFDFSDA